jgi:osmotically inducible protein OsmC
MIRSAAAIWHGGLKDGNGVLSSDSGILHTTPYSFHNRFGDEKGTNPEELIAAAHAGCYSMALSMVLGEAGITADTIETHAHVTIEPVNGAPTVTKIHLETTITAPGADKGKVEAAAQGAKEGCPISRLLKAGAEITLKVTVLG